MGDQNVKKHNDAVQLRTFMKYVLNDMAALEKMIEEGMIESGKRRIGAEQELFLVDELWRPAPIGPEILEEIEDPHYTTELGRFNLEINLEPALFGGNCLSKMEQDLNHYIENLRTVVNRHNAEIAMVGILPTLRKSDLELSNMTPKPRYFALNEAMSKLRRSPYAFQMRGKDELIIKHDNILVEACNTSFQIHFQVGAHEFAKLYNIAQAVTAPVLATATNSPILFGRRLWKETRIAVFQQAVDTRNPSHQLRDSTPRVSFGESWVKNSAIELFREDVSRFKVLLGSDSDIEDPFLKLEEGIAPDLKALRLHSGTVYRWNRVCYGISEGKPHLRIENRVIPSGPTPIDEVANAAFFFGLMSGMTEMYEDITKVMEFDDAKANFLAAARLGLEAQFTWTDGKMVPASRLICKQLLPIAREGLKLSGIDSADIDRYLGVIEERTKSGMTGAQWLLDSQLKMQKEGGIDQVLTALTATGVKRQKEGKPVHLWEPAQFVSSGPWKQSYLYVEQIMATDLFTLREDDLIDLAAKMMDWNHIRHIPVEDEEGRLVGLVSDRRLLRQFGRDSRKKDASPTPVSEIMQKNIITVTPETKTVHAIKMMREYEIPCLPVVKDDKLVGMVAERDFMTVARQLLERELT